MQIQQINLKDFSIWRDQIALLINDSFKQNFIGYPIKENYGYEKCNEVASFLRDRSAIVFIANEQDTLMGWLWSHKYNRLGLIRLHIAEIAVVEKFRKQGVGTALLDAVENYARENKYEEIELFVTANNVAALSFYRNANYMPERYLLKKSVIGCD